MPAPSSPRDPTTGRPSRSAARRRGVRATGVRLLLAAIAALLLATPAAVDAAKAKSEAEAKAELAKVRERIRRITENVQDDLARRDSVAAELREADKSVAGARSRLDEVRDARAQSEKRREALRAEQARTEALLASERDALAAQLRSAYVAGREEQLRVLLNAGDPATLGRMLGYYSYFGRARAANIAMIDEQMTRLDELDQELAAEEAQLAQLEQRRRQEVGALDSARERREKALGALQMRIASRNTELRELRTNAAALERLVEKLRAAIDEFDAGAVAGPAGRGGFAAARGKLPWPARGKVLASYGDARPGGLKWNGLLIETSPGANVRAPYHGRVVYADWLSGLGQLVILDHGGGFISLYANNDRIRTQVGQRVAPGDVLATSSAGGLRPELYFEIRRGSRPVDPRPWLRGGPGR